MFNTLGHIPNSKLNKNLEKRQTEIYIKIVKAIRILRDNGLWLYTN